MLSRYQIASKDDLTNATHEIMQQITLAGLYRGGFFDKAAFYGGTCLRIFHGLQRFSEDMDFSLLQTDEKFSLENYFEPIIAEFKALGKEIIINKKAKTAQTNVESAFLKENTEIYDLQFTTEKRTTRKLGELYYSYNNPDTAIREPLIDFTTVAKMFVRKGEGEAPRPHLSEGGM